MGREAKPEFDPGAIAADISGVLTALAGVTELGSRVDLRLESAGPLQSLAAEVTSRARTLARDTLEERVEAVGVEDAAIEKAREPRERLPLEHADRSTVIGSVRDVKSGEGISGGRVMAKTPDGQVIGESAVDAMGNFAIALTGNPSEVHIEAQDDQGKSVSVSTVELEGEEPAAHFVEMVSSGKSKPAGGKTAAEEPEPLIAMRSPENLARSENLRRVRELSRDLAFEGEIGRPS